MMLNMDFTQRLVVETAQASWIASPASGVWRKPLEKAQAESGWTTSIVRYDAGSAFKTHQHPMGEEILVLSGVFQDEHGAYPKYTWMRSPHLSQHHPFVEELTVILVKTGHLPT